MQPCASADAFVSLGVSFLGLLQEPLGRLVWLANGDMLFLERLLHHIQVLPLVHHLLLLGLGLHLV
jgi:hypothetical protein